MAASFLLRCSLLLLVLSSSFAASDARLLKSPGRGIMKKPCNFDMLYSFGEGSPSITNGLAMKAQQVVAAAFNLNLKSGASFAAHGATVMKPIFFVNNGIQPPAVESSSSLQSQINEFVDLLGAKPTMLYQERKEKLQKALLFINQPGISDYERAFSQGKTITGVSKMVPEVVSAIKNQITKLILNGASNVLVSGVPRLRSLPQFRKLVRDPGWLKSFGLLHNDHLQQALVELKLEFPDVVIVYADYYKMNWNDFSQLAIEFAKAGRCNYFQLGQSRIHADRTEDFSTSTIYISWC